MWGRLRGPACKGLIGEDTLCLGEDPRSGQAGAARSQGPGGAAAGSSRPMPGTGALFLRSKCDMNYICA